MANRDYTVSLYTTNMDRDTLITGRKRKVGEMSGCYYSPEFGDYVNLKRPIDELRKTNRRYLDNPFQLNPFQLTEVVVDNRELNEVVIDKKEKPVDWGLTEQFFADWGSLNV